MGSSHLAEYGTRALVFVRANRKAVANVLRKSLMMYRPHFSHRYYVLKAVLADFIHRFKVIPSTFIAHFGIFGRLVD